MFKYIRYLANVIFSQLYPVWYTATFYMNMSLKMSLRLNYFCLKFDLFVPLAKHFTNQ